MDLPCQRLTEFLFSPNGMAEEEEEVDEEEEEEEQTEKDTVQLSYKIRDITSSR